MGFLNEFARHLWATHAHRCSDASGLWTRLQIPNLESFTCSWFESSGRSRGQNSTKRTQTTDTRHRPNSHFCTKVSPPLLRGHHSEERLGLAAPGIALPSDGLSKLAYYRCSVDGTRSGCRKKQIISSACPRPRDFLSRSCFSKKGAHSTLAKPAAQDRVPRTSAEDLPIEHQQRFRHLRFFAHLSTSNHVSTKSSSHY